MSSEFIGVLDASSTNTSVCLGRVPSSQLTMAGPEHTDSDLNEVRARKEDEDIVCRALLGKSLQKAYSNQIIKLAVNRQIAESMMKERNSTDVMEAFSPERVSQTCKSTGLSQDLQWTSRVDTTLIYSPTEQNAGRHWNATNQAW